MSGCVWVTANEESDMSDISAFIGDLQDLMRKYNVSMEVSECGLEHDYANVTFTCYSEDIDDLKNYEVEWFFEMVDLWPNEAVKVK